MVEKTSKSKLGIGIIDINKKFESEKEALKEHIRYLCKKKQIGNVMQ